MGVDIYRSALGAVDKEIVMNKIQIASIFFVAAMILGPLALGFSAQMEREAKTHQRGLELAALSHDDRYKTLCPTYKDANIIWKMTTQRHLAWCEDYLDKL